jgi:uncharacterized protein (UPF0548 family)
MGEWRFGRGWDDEEVAVRLRALADLERNFDVAEPKTADRGWRRHESETTVAREGAGPPEPAGAFERARELVARYEFSDPGIVKAHFDHGAPLHARRMLLELRALGFRFLGGTVVGAVRDETTAAETVFGYRYDTLRGHVEQGWEWFVVTKSHATGDIRFRISADWQPGEFPNRWSRIGFGIVGVHYQRRWIRRAHARLRHRLATHTRQEAV